MKKLIVIALFFCCITDPSVAGNYYGTPHIEFLNPTPKNDTDNPYNILASNDAIRISSVIQGSHIWVFNAYGQNIYNKTVKDNSVTIPIRSKGVFIIRIKTDKEIYTTKVIVK